MALNAYLKMKGKAQGDIRGSVTQKGREGKIMVIAVDHNVSIPIDERTGAATGRRKHGPFVITKELDQSTPLLYRALITNEAISDWELQFWAPSLSGAAAAGVEINRYTVRLSDVRITDIHFKMLNNKHTDLAKLVECEEVAFSYQRIEWMWVPAGISTVDEIAVV